WKVQAIASFGCPVSSIQWCIRRLPAVRLHVHWNFSGAEPSFDASAASPPARDASPSGVAAANVEPLKHHRASTYGFSESESIMSANELRRGVASPAEAKAARLRGPRADRVEGTRRAGPEPRFP